MQFSCTGAHVHQLPAQSSGFDISRNLVLDTDQDLPFFPIPGPCMVYIFKSSSDDSDAAEPFTSLKKPRERGGDVWMCLGWGMPSGWL